MLTTQIDFENRLAVLSLKKQHGGCRLAMKRFQLLTQWLGPVLQRYDDPMYHHQLENKSRRIAFRGNDAEVREFLMTYSQNNGE